MIIPEEVKKYINEIIKNEYAALLQMIEELKAANNELKIQIAILREGENI